MKSDPQTLAQALDWVHRQLQEQPQAKRWELIEQASQRFNLNPRDAEWLWQQLRQPPEPPPGP